MSNKILARKLFKVFFGLVLCLGFVNTTFAQTKNQERMVITGKVVDQKGEVVPGVNVFEKSNIVNGIITDYDGNFSIEIDKGKTLVFSFIGFYKKEVVVDNKNKLEVTLVEEISDLDEVVIVGYGTTTKRKMASSVSTLKTDKMSEAPYSSIVEGLAGRSAGLFVQSNGGEYGSMPTVSIRGRGKPTYVVDGMIVSEGEFGCIPASDIEELSFLKDAAATAVYGFSAANGVVVVKTKRGSDGKLSLKYNFDYGMQQPLLIPNYLSSVQSLKLKNQAAFNDGLPPLTDQEIIDQYVKGNDPRYPSIDPFKEVVNDLTPQKRHNLTLDGTINKTKLYMSFDYYDQDGIYKQNDFGLERYSWRTNISHEFENIGLLMNANMSLQRNLKESPAIGTATIWSHLRNYPVIEALYNPEGNYTGFENPLAEADKKAGYRKEEENRIKTQLEFIYQVPNVKGLSLKAVGNYNYNNKFHKVWRANQKNIAPIYTWDNVLVDVGKPRLFEFFERGYSYNLEAHINYLRTFKDVHTFEFTGVYTQSEGIGDNFSAYRENFPSPAVDQLFAGSSIGKDNNGMGSEWGRIGYVTRFKYDYAAKYIGEVNFRYDGYDGFPEDQRWEMFPSVSLAWNADQEEWLQPIFEKIKMNSFKIRGSWGEVGKLGENDDEIAANKFGHLSKYDLINNAYYINGQWKTGFREGPLTPMSGTTSWYSIESKNLGVDFAFFKNKISGNFDVFYERITGYLGSPNDIYTTPLGKDLPMVNTDAALRRAGVEFSLNYKMNIGEAVVNMGGNISNYDQLWEERNDESEDDLKNPYSRKTQQRDYYTVGYTDLGLYQTMDEVLNSPRRLASTQTMRGDIRYEDFNGDGVINGDDQTRIGKSNFPHLTYGFNFDVKYKGWTMLALFQGTGQRQMYQGSMWKSELRFLLYDIQNDYWREDNTDAMFPRASTKTNVNGNNNVVSSTYWMVDAWYLRMKSLSISYNFKYKLLRNFDAIKSLNLILSGTNLFTISPVNEFYLDPETSSYDNYSYPLARTFNIGVRVSL